MDNNSMVKYFEIYKEKGLNIISSRRIPVLQSIGKLEDKLCGTFGSSEIITIIATCFIIKKMCQI